MRVLTLPSWFPSPDAPVAGSFIDEFVGALAEYHPEVLNDVVLLRPEIWLAAKRPLSALAAVARDRSQEPVRSRRDDRGFMRHEVRTRRWTDRLFNGGRTRAAREVYRLCRALERTGPSFDLVHAHVVEPAGRVARRVANVLGVPLVITEQMSPFPFAELVAPDGSLNADVRRVFAEAAAVIAPSRAQANDIGRRCDCSPIVIPNGCNDQEFMPRTGGRPQRSTLDLIAVGGLLPQKGFDVLLAAFARAHSARPRLRLTICGDGPDRSVLHAQAERLSLAGLVRWAGLVDRGAMPEAFRAADAFVLSSRHESFGVVCIEAAATGLPILATDCGGPGDIVTEVNGILVAPDSVDALADGLVQLHDSIDRFDPAAIRADFLRRFSFKAVTQRVVDLYENVLSRASRVDSAKVTTTVGAT